MSEDERAAERLPDSAVVIRGSYTNYGNYRVSVENHYDNYDEYALSVFCLPGCDSGEEVARDCCEFHGEVFREATVGQIRAAGYEVVRNEPPLGHALIKGLTPSRDDWQRLRGVLGDIKTNPYYDDEGG